MNEYHEVPDLPEQDSDSQKTPASQGARTLERLENGTASINQIRAEYGLGAIDGGDELLVKRDVVTNGSSAHAT